jgi:DNA repair photolyase
MTDPRSGRGATHNPVNRFLQVEFERADDFYEGAFAEDLGVRPATNFLVDASRTIVTKNDSPDLPMEATLNPYRGCEHGCSYCYARPTHEYLGFSAGLDFELNVLVKKDAPQLLREHLMRKTYQPVTIAMSGVTDCYQPVERHLRVTRGCLEVMLEFRNPTAIVTKNFLVTRDIDLLSELARWGCAHVMLSITSLDADLANRMEPRASTPQRRLEAVRRLTAAGVPTSVMIAPVVPGLTDHEIPAIVAAAAEAGASNVRFLPLRLPGNVVAVFTEWLQAHFPDRKEKVLARIRSLRGGKLNDANFFTRFQGEGHVADGMAQLHKLALRKAGLPKPSAPLSKEHFRRPGPEQLSLF